MNFCVENALQFIYYTEPVRTSISHHLTVAVVIGRVSGKIFSFAFISPGCPEKQTQNKQIIKITTIKITYN